VHVPRIFLVNMRTPRDDKGRRVERTLPRARPCLHLYEVRQSEAEWQETSKELTHFLHEPNVEGVYETRVSLAFRFLMEIGCVARVNKARYRKESREAQQLRAATAASSSGSSSSASSASASSASSSSAPLPLSMQHLDMYSGGDTPAYLSHAVYRRLFFYHSHASDGRAVFALIAENAQTQVPYRSLSRMVSDTVSFNSHQDPTAKTLEPNYSFGLYSVWVESQACSFPKSLLHSSSLTLSCRRNLFTRFTRRRRRPRRRAVS
jgi:hypothetical protein